MRRQRLAPTAASTRHRDIGHDWIFCLPLALLLLVAVFTASAHAAPETIASSGSGAGQVAGPNGIAVDRSSGDFYVADGNNNRIDKFDADGNFLFAWGWGVRDGLDSGLQTCGPQATPPSVLCFRGLVGASGAGAISPGGVAVDQGTGDVYAIEFRKVSKFTSSGEFVYAVGRNVNETKVALGGGASQAEKNICTAASGDTCGSAESGTGPDEFTESTLNIAVDSTGVVWVGDNDRLTSFSASTGAAGAEIALPGASYTSSLALDSNDNFYVISAAIPGVRKLEAGTGTLLKTFDTGGQARTVTLDQDDNIYVGDATSPYRFKVYNSAGEQTFQFGAGEVIGSPGNANIYGGNALAVGDSAGKLYVASSSSSEGQSVVQSFPLPEPGPLVVAQGITDVLPTSATLTATIDPENDQTVYWFEYGTDESYGHSTPTETLAAEEFEAEDVEAQIEELIPSTTYHFRVVATNHCNPADPTEVCTAQGGDETFVTRPAVAIEGQWASDVFGHSAVLHGELDPLGVESEAWLEYGTSEAYGQVVPLANLGSGFGVVTRQVQLTELQAATTYHYRFAAHDERDGLPYTVHGPDRTFTTSVGGLGFELADNRAWEMVSPRNKHGARLYGGGEVPVQASAGGGAVAYQSYLSTETDPEGNRITESSMNLARRGPDGSWSSQDITPPNERVSGKTIGDGSEYKLFSSDLSEAVLEPRSGTPLSPEASERTPYLRANTNPAAYTPLVTGKEPYANVPPGIEFGGGGSSPGVKVVGASLNFRHFALSSSVPLIEGVPLPAPSPTLYEWSSGQIKPVSVLPAGEGGSMVRSTPGAGSGDSSVRGAVSEDGSRVFWSFESAGAISALYVRDTDAEETARIDVVRGGSGEGPGRPIFQGASADGRVVFFTDTQQLTEVSPAGNNLYRCELPAGSIASGCATLTDISVPNGAVEAGEHASVQGIAPGFTSDGQSIYFVAKGVLDAAPNQFGESAVPGEPNLYHWQQSTGDRFIASLAVEDMNDWGVLTQGVNGRAMALSASASPSGRYLAFMSQRNLTGYDNHDVNTGEPAQELFRYDALTEALECVSCNASGGRPRSATPPPDSSLVSPVFGMWNGLRTAATLPLASTRELSGRSLSRSRAVLDNGRIFFNAIDSLVAGDSNGNWDVYEYEPTGVGDCSPSSGGTSIARLAGGCVSLVTSGTAEDEAAFVDASETGDDAFIFSSARLSVLDEDNEVDIYDARVDGVPATLPASVECLGEACQPLAQAPDDPTPASAAFRGAGNMHPVPKPCPKGKHRVRKHGHVRCVAKKHHRGRSGPGKHRRATHNRRVTR